jgi:hypothetical protein
MECRGLPLLDGCMDACVYAGASSVPRQSRTTT